MRAMFVGRTLAVMAAGAMVLAVPRIGRADEVLDWNAVVRRAVVTANTPGAFVGRVMAIVHTAVFDAVNGIERRYTSLTPPTFLNVEAPRGASRRAAAAQAAYTALAALFPAQAAAFASDLDVSLAAIAADAGVENSESIQRGREWGRRVAAAVLAWRATDGFNVPSAPNVGRLEAGIWRPTPRPGAPGQPELEGLPFLGVTMATTAPFVIPTSSSFRAQRPHALTSLEYAADFNEVKSVGEATSTARTPDQTQSARFWAGTAATFWNRTAETAARQRNTTLSQNARLFALLNAAMADSIIACWDTKAFYLQWRPITAIRLADTDGNPLTDARAGWVPLIVTPPYPDHNSGHQSISGSSQAILTAFFGDRMPVEGFSEGLPGVVRRWPSFEAAADEAFMARIWSGIHVRAAMTSAREVSEAIAAYVLEHAAQPLNGERAGQLRN